MSLRTGIGLAIRVYRKTPLYPRCGAALASILARVQSVGQATPIEHTVGDFRMRLYLDQVIDSQIYYTGSFDPDAERTIHRLVKEDDVVFDVGANVGYLTLHLAKQVCRQGRVFAFEPIDETFGRLTTNIALNDLPQVMPIQAGVSDTTLEQVSVTINNSYRLDGQGKTREQRIRFTTIDDFVQSQGLNRLDFVKIDTDGMEVRVLQGGQQSLKRFVPSILTECGPGDLRKAGSTADTLIDMLDALGYQFYSPGTLAPMRNLSGRLKKLRGNTSLNVVAIHSTRDLDRDSANTVSPAGTR